MNRLPRKGTAVALGLLLTASGAALADHPDSNPNVIDVKPGDTVKVSRIPGSIYLRTQDDPDDLIWERLPQYRTDLYIAPPVHPSVTLRFDITDDQPKHLYFQVARSDERFYMRFRWRDATENRDTTVDGFRDGVAVQYALGDRDTNYMMGTGPENPVNIWYWRSDQDGIENLAAGGFGSTTSLPVQNVTGSSSYISEEIQDNNEWHVVMSRPLESEGDHQVDLSREQIPMVFAIWDGQENERDGNKKVTHNWILLDNRLNP